ncbi:hypothetical protein QJQ45_019611 [Haematococcus lacustris]|nr:hypothetical protein QJQ45_019611 [Haematococcus lacustris]
MTLRRSARVLSSFVRTFAASQLNCGSAVGACWGAHKRCLTSQQPARQAPDVQCQRGFAAAADAQSQADSLPPPQPPAPAAGQGQEQQEHAPHAAPLSQDVVYEGPLSYTHKMLKADRNKRSCTWPGLGFQFLGLVGLLLSSSSSQGWGLFKIELTLLVRNSFTVTTLPGTLSRVSIGNTLVALAAAPLIMMYAEVSYVSRVGLAASLVFFGFLTTGQWTAVSHSAAGLGGSVGALHWITHPYIHELKYTAATGTIDTRMTNVFGFTRRTQFQLCDVQPLPWDRPVATFMAKGQYYYIDVYSFPDPDLLKHLTPSEVPAGYKDDKDDD